MAHTMDRLLFGDNQFFGINHMSEEKARAGAMRFQKTQAIVDVLDVALAEGVRTFMCTTHDRILEIADIVRADPAKYGEFIFYPGMPYAHKYANAVTEDGYLGTLKRFLPSEGLLDAALRGGMSIANKDVEGLITLLVDAEMKMFDGVKAPVIFLQNVVVDLLLGLKFKDAFRIFADHVRKRYDAEPGYITMNLPLLLRALEAQGVENPIVCANMNKIGFRMSGGWDAYAQAMDAYPVPRDRHVDLRQRRDPAGRGDPVGRRPAADRIDGVRRVEPRQHPQHGRAGKGRRREARARRLRRRSTMPPRRRSTTAA